MKNDRKRQNGYEIWLFDFTINNISVILWYFVSSIDGETGVSV